MYQVTDCTCTCVCVPVKLIKRTCAFHAIGLANEQIYLVTQISHYTFPVYELYNKVLDTELVRQGLSNPTSKLLCWRTLTNFALYFNKHYNSTSYLLAFRHRLQTVAQESLHNRCFNLCLLVWSDFLRHLYKE